MICHIVVGTVVHHVTVWNCFGEILRQQGESKMSCVVVGALDKTSKDLTSHKVSWQYKSCVIFFSLFTHSVLHIAIHTFGIKSYFV